MSADIYRTIMELSPTGIFIHQDGRYVLFNSEFVRIHGYSSQELSKINYLDLIHPDERAKVKRMVAKRLKGDFGPKRYEIRRLRKNGETVWCEMMASPITYRGRAAIMGTLIDITSRRRIEEELQESELKYRTIFE